jgi:hypothetical protein
MSSDGSLGSVSGWPVRHSVSHRGRGDITSSVTAVRSRPDRRGPPASPVGRTRRSCPRSKSKRCWTCCARTASLTAASGNAGRHCSTKASTCARNRRCTGSCVITSWQVNAVNADPGGTPGRDWSRPPRTRSGCGTSRGCPAPAEVSGSTGTRSGTCGHARPLAGAWTSSRPPRSPNG